MSEIAVQNTELVAAGTLFGTDNPGEVVERASAVARTLADVVRKQRLIVRIGQSEHVRVEGWTFLGSLLGVFPVVEWTRPILDGDQPVGWEARVEARTRSGEVVGAAEAECLRAEKTWKGRDDYALRSMAQTRAVSKALRLPLGFVMQLAGFDPTPADEMPVVDGGRAVDDDRLFPPVDENGEIIPAGALAEPETDSPGDARDPQAGAEAGSSGSPSADRSTLTAAQAKKLNVLVGKLRPDHVSTLQLWQGMGRDPVPSEDGLLHWSPLRDSLSRDEASALIERLVALEEKVGGFQVPESARVGGGAAA